MNRLVDQRRVRIRKGLPARTPRYYQLTRSELKARGLPESRARRPKLQAFPTAISVLWFCNMLEAERHLLEAREVSRIFPSGLPNGIHCIERSSESHCIYRIRQVAPNTDVEQLLRKLRTRVSQAIRFPGLRPWVTTGRYAFAVMLESSFQAQVIRDRLQADPFLNESARVLVEAVPALSSLETNRLPGSGH